MKYIIIATVIILAAWFVWDALSQPGVSDLEGNFKEEAFYRNENNTGPIIRIYAVSVEDTLWNEMLKYGNYMPHNKYGNTKVYFFLKDNPLPKKVFPGDDNFEDEYKSYCLGVYEKDAMSSVSFRREPFL